MQDIHERRLLLDRRRALLSAFGAAAWLAGCGGGDDDSEDAADPRVQSFWRSYFDAKSNRDADALSALFGPNVEYEDNSLRRRMAGSNAFIRSQWQGLFAYIPPGPRSVFRGAGGTMQGAAVELTNEAGLFASVPIDGLSIVDLQDGKIARITDYWDSSNLAQGEWDGLNAGFAANPAWPSADTGDHSGTSSATTGLMSFVADFFAAYAGGKGAVAAKFFSPNAMYRNRPLGITASGPDAIGSMLSAALNVLPDGAGAQLTHVVGNALGGGFEWLAASTNGQTLRGATALELSNGQITRMTVYFDGRLVSEQQRKAIVYALR